MGVKIAYLYTDGNNPGESKKLGDTRQKGTLLKGLASDRSVKSSWEQTTFLGRVWAQMLVGEWRWDGTLRDFSPHSL